VNPNLKAVYYRRAHPEADLEDVINGLLTDGWDLDDLEEGRATYHYILDTAVAEEELAAHLTRRSAEGYEDLNAERIGSEEYGTFNVTGARATRFYVVTASKVDKR
jgi:hypothetical protein